MRPDVNLLSLDPAADNFGLRTNLRLRADPAIHADAYKLSNIRHHATRDFEIHGGYEDCVDANRGENLSFERGKCHINGKHGFTIKGGLVGFSLTDVEFFGRPKVAHIELGNWSDQLHTFSVKTRDGALINVRTNDGSPVIISVLNATRPLIEDCGPIEWRVWPRPVLWAYWTARRNNWIKK